MAWRQPTNLREWLAIVTRHRKKFFFSAMPVMVAIVISSHWMKREYRAQAVFERINDAALQQMGSGTINRNLKPIRQRLSQDLRGRAAVEQLAEDLQLLRNLPHTVDGELTNEGQLMKYDLVKDMTRRIRIRLRIRSANLDQVVISFTDVDRTLAPRVVNRLMENYINKTRQQLNEMLVNAKAFFEREVARYRARVSELDGKKLRFELEHPGLKPDDPGSVESELAELRSQFSAATLQKRIAEEKRTKLQEWIETQPDFIEKSQTGQNPELVVVHQKMAKLETELEGHLYTMGRTEEHPAVIRTRTRLNELEEEARSLEENIVVGVEMVPNTDRIAAEREVEGLSGMIVALERRVGELSEKVEKKEILKRNFFVVRNDYLQIQRELAESKRQLGFWDKNLQSTMTALTAEIGQRGVRLRPIERAPELARPSKPTISSILMTAAAAGLGTGTVLIILSELLDHSFRDVEQAVDKLKLPVMGTVNEIASPAEVFRRKVLGWGLYPTVGTIMILVLLASVWIAYLSLNEPKQFEQFRKSPGQYINNMILPRRST